MELDFNKIIRLKKIRIEKSELSEDENVKLIFEHYEKIEGLREYYEEGCGPFDTPQYIEELSKIHSYVDRLIAIFLPKFSIKPEP